MWSLAIPVITWPPWSQTLVEGEILVLKCKAFSQPPAEILWFHNDIMVSEGPEGKSIVGREGGEVLSVHTFLCV